MGGTLISSRLTAWENLLDSVSHIGPLTNNPAEAKRLQVIRPDQNAPLAQKLGPKMDQYLTGKSRRNKKKRNRNNDKKKTNQRREKKKKKKKKKKKQKGGKKKKKKKKK